VGDVIDELIDHTPAHFVFEETMLEDVNYVAPVKKQPVGCLFIFCLSNSTLIHAPVLHRFGDMGRLNVFTISQVRDGARHFKDAMVSAC